jgi:hypothetical protein
MTVKKKARNKITRPTGAEAKVGIGSNHHDPGLESNLIQKHP